MFSNVFFCAATWFFVLFVICEGRSIDNEDAGHNDDASYLRSRRSTVLTEAEKQAVVDVHNNHRRVVGASDMQKLKWNEDLADLASQWVQNCTMKRGSPDRDEADWKAFGNLGQVMDQTDEKPNISAIFDTIVTGKRKISSDSRCMGNVLCLMYDEIFAAVSTDVGCATGYCQPMNTKIKSSQSNKWFTVCYYGPGRESLLEDPYQKGTACSKCPDAKWCDEGLCNSDCKKSGGKCECGAECRNCGKVDPETCTCKCPKWLAGDDCSETCEDHLPCCTRIAESPKSVKDEKCSLKHFQDGCPLSCGVCEVSHEESGATCPVDRISPPYKPKPSF